jgi:hypothetical protein
MADQRNRPGGQSVPGWVLVANVIGACVFVAIGLDLYVAGHSVFGVLIAVWAVVITPLAWWQKLRRARSVYDSARRSDDRTGMTLAPPIDAEREQASRWVGAADIPTPFGRITTTYQVAVLEILEGKLILRLRPGALTHTVVRAKPLSLLPTDVEAVFPARGRLRIPAIGIRPVGRPPSYFLTASRLVPWYFGRISGDRAAILSAIQSAGFPVDWDERSFSRS